jgi:hypothetical protein
VTSYEDLSTYTDSPSEQPMLNVGWLGADRSFPTGEVDERLLPALIRLAAEPRNVMRGYHYCEFCDAESPIRYPAPGTPRGRVSLGDAEIHVRGQNGVVYAAPTLIIHYIDAHNYQPPGVFVEAVLAQDGD